MRPDQLNPLFAPVTTLSGVGPKAETLFRRLLGRDKGVRIIDLLFHLPSGVIDRRARPKLREVVPGMVATVAVTIDRHRPPAPGRPRSPYLVYASDETGDIVLTFFNVRRDYVERLFPIGARRYVSGRIGLFDGMLQMVHPDRVVDHQGLAKLPLIEPVYSLTEGLSGHHIRKAMETALRRLPALPEWQDPAFLQRSGYPSFTEALQRLHQPTSPADVLPEGPAWSRLAYDELLASQLALALMRASLQRAAGARAVGNGYLRERIIATLPYQLTPSQSRALDAIVKDLGRPHRMLRLLQGDVGSGKTIVALLACAAVIEAGRQAAFMAPTELLARQHLKTIAPIAQAVGLKLAILTGRERGRERDDILQHLSTGNIDLLIGTHALFQDEVRFRDLALAVIDEQHRFGVHQRLALARKGEAVDMLIMTATPIPRTLVLSYFGDMDVSELREKPAGRKPIDTRVIPLERLGEVIDAVGRALFDNQRIYWVCPLVEESEATDLAAAQERYAALRERFGAIVGLVHGRMRSADRDRAMERFAQGDIRILVATTVIEVGVNVPEATVMIIEHAERFGLAQLHQLRGRVGRGHKPSTCLLLYKGPLSETAMARLAVMRETEDGFRIAEEDLRLRGEGDVLGIRQSGMPGFRLARIDTHGFLLQAAREDISRALARDPSLTSPRGNALRLLLHLFERHEAIPLIHAG